MLIFSLFAASTCRKCIVAFMACKVSNRSGCPRRGRTSFEVGVGPVGPVVRFARAFDKLLGHFCTNMHVSSGVPEAVPDVPML